ncbi:MAG: signal peptidase I [Bacillota bacterium]
MIGRLISLVTWLLVAGSLAIIMGGLAGRPVLLAAVPTTSMVPALYPGDLIAVVPLLGRRLSVGQIVVFKTEKDPTWIVHRIIGGSEQEGFITQGDGNQTPDPYLVYPRHVAGVVPMVGERVAKVSGLGALSLERGPLSNPYVAAVAMVLGIYLLASDQTLAWRGFAPVVRRRRARGLAGVVALYLALGLGVSMLTYLSTWSLSSRQAGRVEVVRELYPWSSSHQILLGGERQEQVTLENPSRVPLIMGLSASDPSFRWSPAWVWLPPGSERQVTLSVAGEAPGRKEVLLRQSVYLPFLPVAFLQAMARLHWHLPAVAVALVPLLLMTAIALTDRRLAGRLRAVWTAISLWAR